MEGWNVVVAERLNASFANYEVVAAVYDEMR